VTPPVTVSRLFSELFGTFLLVLAAAGAGVVNAQSDGAISRAAGVTAPGLMVMAVILFMGAVSGAHLNPGVTLAFSLRGDFPWRRLPGYVVAQLAGASLACLFLAAVFGKIGELGATKPGEGVADWKAMLMELVLSVGLVSTILGTASEAQNVGPLSAVGVGGYIVLAGLWSSPISGASMNTARSFGPDLVLGSFGQFWVYVVGPLAGAALAVGFAWVLRGPGGDRGGVKAARGTLDGDPVVVTFDNERLGFFCVLDGGELSFLSLGEARDLVLTTRWQEHEADAIEDGWTLEHPSSRLRSESSTTAFGWTIGWTRSSHRSWVPDASVSSSHASRLSCNSQNSGVSFAVRRECNPASGCCGSRAASGSGFRAPDSRDQTPGVRRVRTAGPGERFRQQPRGIGWLKATFTPCTRTANG
jgi:aquaporin Z